MGLLDELRVDIGDDEGAIPSGIAPVPTSGLPVGTNTTLLSELRVDTGDDDGVIPSGSLANGIPVHNLLSLQHGDTTPAAPFTGAIIIGGATWRILGPGNDGEQLTLVGGSPTWAPDASGITAAQVSGIAVIVVTAGIAIHAAISDAHHARYTDAEAIAASSGALDHHVRYTDAEASGVAVQVVTTGIAIHSADSSAHHARYTDAEAIAASSGALDHHLRYTDAEASGVAVIVVTSGIANHAAISDAHHARYTDAEVSGITSGLITIHAADSGAHHARYTDAEASGVASGLITVHAAISGAHHPRYTDAEAIIAVAPLIAVLQESGIELSVDATTTAVLPALSTLLSVPIDLINSSGDLRIVATAAINANGPVPVVFHIYIDGVFHRGTTVNVTGAIDTASIVIPRVATSGISHTVELRWAKFASPFVTVNCLPASLPDFYHASLSVQELL